MAVANQLDETETTIHAQSSRNERRTAVEGHRHPARAAAAVRHLSLPCLRQDMPLGRRALRVPRRAEPAEARA